MKCMQCGNDLAASDKFCGKCGVAVADNAVNPASAQEPGTQATTPDKKKSGTALKVFLVIIAIVIVNLLVTEADRDESGVIIAEGDLDAMQMQVGDCFDDAADISSDVTVEIQSVHGLPCTEPHDNEVYAKFELEVDEFPGEEEILVIADEGCMERFVTFVGVAYEESVLDIFYMFPTLETWTRMNDREVVCAVFHAAGEKLSNSMQDSML